METFAQVPLEEMVSMDLEETEEALDQEHKVATQLLQPQPLEEMVDILDQEETQLQQPPRWRKWWTLWIRRSR
ncbi:hypothetical protein TNCT_298171 [Trichonephila clavata]|uniref:Uncharacterized protein n=1 Tax=Trichonephila clavata TaxID=2740835 RepID=A0A8X6IHI8_TRICU|nr:hypothetical protein TNCT_298171 [Trichonephila clavata]